MRPYETIASALDAWKRGDPSRADSLFQRGIEQYARSEPDGLDFALGRYGAFLKKEGRVDEAARVLERAINHKTDIPAIWADYLGILADRRDIDALFATASRRPEGRNFIQARHEILLGHARRAARAGDLAFAESIARRVVAEASAENLNTRWTATGDLGQILQKAGRTEEAEALWSAAFAEGSDNPVTATNLSLLLERKKDFSAAVDVLRAALQRNLPATTEEQLRKRLARCEEKLGRKPRPSDVDAFSIRQGAGAFHLTFQVRIKPPLRDVELVQGVARCLTVAQGTSTLIDIELGSGREVRRIEELPMMHDVQFSQSGWGIGIERLARIGTGSTNLVFLDPTGAVASRQSVPDATSQIACSSDQWYVGCRNGRLYAFDSRGKSQWEWETPGVKKPAENPYLRPCPYYVAAADSYVTTASMNLLFGIDAATGRQLWQTELASDQSAPRTITVPVRGQPSGPDPFSTLGINSQASHEEAKKAYRRLVLATHPDHNPEDPEAAATFRQIQSAYESILAGTTTPLSAKRVTLTIQFSFRALVSFLAANEAGVFVGSSRGRVYLLDRHGGLQQARVMGHGQVRGLLRPDGSIAATWCDGIASFFDGRNVVNAAEVPEYPAGLALLGDDIVVSRGNEVWVLDHLGRRLWAAEFSRRVTRMAAQESRIVCAAGVVAVFERTK